MIKIKQDKYCCFGTKNIFQFILKLVLLPCLFILECNKSNTVLSQACLSSFTWQSFFFWNKCSPCHSWSWSKLFPIEIVTDLKTFLNDTKKKEGLVLSHATLDISNCEDICHSQQQGYRLSKMCVTTFLEKTYFMNNVLSVSFDKNLREDLNLKLLDEWMQIFLHSNSFLGFSVEIERKELRPFFNVTISVSNMF